MKERDYESTVMRITGTLLSGASLAYAGDGLYSAEEVEQDLVARAVRRARAIVAEVKRTQPAQELRDAAEQR